MSLAEQHSAALVDPLVKYGIIPDVIPDSSFSSSFSLSIEWPNNKKANLGNNLTTDDTHDEPSISFTPVVIPAHSTGQPFVGSGSLAADKTYTLVMVDPDAPSKADPKYRQFRHWVVTGLKASSNSIPGNSAATKSKTITPYRPPGPGRGTGTHRYVFLLFQELKSPLIIPPGSPEYGSTLEERRSWNAVGFGKKYDLKLVGANFFLLDAIK